METKDYVKSLFADYEETAELRDFIEEVSANMDDRIALMVKKGETEECAFEKARAELGDVSALAKEISLQKRKEVFAEQYMDIRRYMNGFRVAGYVVGGALAAFGLLSALLVYFAVANYTDIVMTVGPDGSLVRTWPDLAGVFGVVLPFLTASAGVFTFLGLSQETATRYPMKKKRAAWYTVAVVLMAFGILMFPLVYFSAGMPDGLVGGLAVLLPFTLAGGGILAWLLLTEKPRLKPWAVEQSKKDSAELFGSGKMAAAFGMVTAAIWIFALGFFLLFGILFTFTLSWLAFIFALALQLVAQFVFALRGKAEKARIAGGE
jgi:hypothetical protein